MARPILAVPVRAGSPGCIMMVPEVHQRVDLGIDEEDHIAAVSAVAAGRAAVGHVFLAAKCHGAIAAVAGFYTNLGCIEKHRYPVG